MRPFDLRKWNPSCELTIDSVVIDSRRISTPRACFVALEGENEDGHSFVKEAAEAGASCAIVENGFTLPKASPLIQLIRVDSPKKTLQEIAASYRASLNIPIVAICGTYGKTMTKDLLGAILKTHYQVCSSPESFNSQIGVPLSLFTMEEGDELALIEAAISKPGEMDVLADLIDPTYTIMTSTDLRHLATLKTEKTLIAEQMKMVEKTKKWALLPNCDKHEEGLPFAEALGDGKYRVKFPDHPPFEGALPFRHHSLISLVNRCVKAAAMLGVPSQKIHEGLGSYTPEPMYSEVWTTPTGVTIINDIYTSDPLSIQKALHALPPTGKGGKKIFVFDGFRNREETETECRLLSSELEKANISHLVLIGKSHLYIQGKVEQFATHKEALIHLRPQLKGGDLVLIKGRTKHPIEEVARALSDAPCENRLLINSGALRSNLDLIRTRLHKNTRILVMVKARGYGTDHVVLGNTLASLGIDILGVAHVDEAISLREGGVRQSIFVINTPPFEVEKLVRYGFEVGVSDCALVDAINEEARRGNKTIKVHLHIDTGMNRFGCRPKEALNLARTILASPHLELVGVMTHLAVADQEDDDAFTHHQIDLFTQTLSQLKEAGIEPPFIHLANSSGMLRFDIPFCNMVRLGLALFGIVSTPAEKQTLPFRPALSLVSRIAGINRCEEGETVSYGRTYQIKEKEQRIGIIPLGYFDGIHRHYSGKGYVLIHGQKAPMVGQICMDYMMVDLNQIRDAKIGDPVLVFGEDFYGNSLSPELFSAWGETDVRELISCLGPRIQRLFIDEER